MKQKIGYYIKAFEKTTINSKPLHVPTTIAIKVQK